MKNKSKNLSMFQYMCYMSVVILMLCGLVVLLSSCTDTTDSSISPYKGQEFAVKFKFAGVNKPGYEVVTNRSASTISPEGQFSPIEESEVPFVIPVADDLLMYATLEVDREVNLRADTISLTPGTMLRIVAYENGIVYRTHADYKIDSNGELDNRLLKVAPGNYKFVAYSYTTTTLPPHDNETLWNIDPAIDLLWGCYPTSGTYPVTADAYKEVPITLSHLFSQVRIQATTVNIPGNIKITGMNNVKMLPDNSVNLAIKSGGLTQGNGIVQHFTWPPSLGATTVNSELRTVYTHGADLTTLKIGSVTIDGNRTFTDREALFNKQLQSGVSYMLRVSFKKFATIGEQGAAGERIYIDENGGDPKLMLTKNPTNKGAMFQFGGIRGWDYNSGTAAGRAGYNPTTLSGAWDSNWQYANSQGNVVAHTLANLRAGKGDPCRLVGYTQREVRNAIATTNPNAYVPDNKQWRLPDANDFLYYSTVYSKISQMSGVEGYRFGYEEVFLPLVGEIEINGNFYRRDGGYWSSFQRITTPSANNANYLWLRDARYNVVILYATIQTYGRSIHCVRQ